MSSIVLNLVDLVIHHQSQGFEIGMPAVSMAAMLGPYEEVRNPAGDEEWFFGCLQVSINKRKQVRCVSVHLNDVAHAQEYPNAGNAVIDGMGIDQVETLAELRGLLTRADEGTSFWEKNGMLTVNGMTFAFFGENRTGSVLQYLTMVSKDVEVDSDDK